MIRLSLPTEPVIVSADKEELTSVFSNLLDNAVKYSPAGPKITVRVSARVRWIDVVIKDAGIGISRADLKRVFKRFYRSHDKAAGPAKGTGLGLAIVKKIMEDHRGQLMLLDREHGGARVRLVFAGDARRASQAGSLEVPAELSSVSHGA